MSRSSVAGRSREISHPYSPLRSSCLHRSAWQSQGLRDQLDRLPLDRMSARHPTILSELGEQGHRRRAQLFPHFVALKLRGTTSLMQPSGIIEKQFSWVLGIARVLPLQFQRLLSGLRPLRPLGFARRGQVVRMVYGSGLENRLRVQVLQGCLTPVRRETACVRFWTESIRSH